MSTMKFIAQFIFIFAFFISGCTSVREFDAAKTLETNTWLLRSLNGSKITLSSGKDITLEFAGGSRSISGFGGCNRYSGKYMLNKDRLFFSGIGSTEMACDDLKTETDYYKMLSKVYSHRVSGDSLYLSDSTGTVILRFRAK